MAADLSVDPDRWLGGLDELMTRIAHRVGRVEPRRRVRKLMLVLLTGLPRAHCWTIAEHAGEASPDGMQHLLARAVWAHDAVLVVDETGDLKKGTATVGGQRQYTGTAGRVENAQVAVYLVYAAAGGYAFIDRALYLPRSWADDPHRRAAAGVPAEVGFATKPALARQMIARALDVGTPASWVAGDDVYGNDPGLRGELVGRGIGYVLAVAKDYRISTGIGSRRAIDLAVRLPPLSAGRGAKGHRWYDWALVDTVDPAAGAGCHWLLIRRNRAPASWRSTAPSPRPRCHSSPWSGSPEPAGRSRNRSNPARNSLHSTSTRSAAGPPGTAGPSW